MFVKPDKYPSNLIEEKAPRAIQFRHPRFNLQLMRYTKPIEEHMKTITLGVVSDTQVFVKGLNPTQRAELFLAKVKRFDRPIYLELDHTKFDSSISEQWLLASHRKYLKMIPSKVFANLLSQKLKNKGLTKYGLRYKTRGTRMSGDADTSLGNGIVNADALVYVLIQSSIQKYDLLIDGDDSVIIIETSDLPKFKPSIFEDLGFNTKLKVVKDLVKVEFCQSQVVLGAEPKFVRHPHRALTKIFACRHNYDKDQRLQWLAGVGMCEMSLNQDMPVLGPIGYELAKLHQKPIVEHDLQWRMMGVQVKKELKPLERQAYYETFGLDPSFQQLLEQSVQSIVIGCRSRRLSNILAYLEYGDESVSGKRSWLYAMDESCSSCWWGCCESGCG